MTNAVDDYDDLLDDGNHRWRKRLILSALVAALAVACVFVLWATMLRGGGPAESAVQTAKVQRGSIMKTISTSATTASQATANLSFGSSGKVTAVNVSVGQEVKQGDVLAEVESTTLQDAVTRAQVNLSSAQTKLNQLLEGSTTAELASADQSVIQAEANLDKADAALEDLYAGPTTEERDTAQQSVLNAESQLAKAQTARANVDTAWSNAVAAAEAAVEKAQTALDKAESSAVDAADALSLAEAKLEGAENSYCASDNSPSFCTSNATPISSSDESDLLTLASEGNQQASNVLSANNAYKTARSAKSNAEDAVDRAEADLQTAEDNLDELGSGPSSDDIASADAAVESAQLTLKMANDKLAGLDQAPSEDDVTQAQHNVDSAAAALVAAQAKRDETYQGSKPEDIDAQEDQVRLAQISVDEAKRDLEKAQIIAPFDGTVAALNITIGDTAGSSSASSSSSTSTSSSTSSSSAAIVLNTPNALVLNLSIGESDLPSVKAGQSGTATFDAISGRIFPITIDTVGTNPTTTQGVVTYQARARILTRDSARAAATAQSAGASSGQAPSAAQAQASSDATTTAEPVPGMNASVTIIIDQAQDVLTVPATAVQTEGRSKYVTVQKDDGSKEKVTVETGLSDDSNTEITSGLEEGQTVIIPGATSTSSSSGQDTSSQQTNPFFGGGPPGGFPGGD
ncbi:MAG: biotin/lipoyl-binding protein [Dehalococcoidia bacterium]|nr:biotin/lipoyl-binding protein [Dehalococcoidia bacterium]